MKWVAGVAQLVEQRIRNAKVGGSIPLTGHEKVVMTKLPRRSAGYFFSFFTAIKIRQVARKVLNRRCFSKNIYL